MAKAKTGRPKPDAVAPASKPAPSAGMAGSPAARPAPPGAGRYTLWALARTAPARHAETGLGGGRGGGDWRDEGSARLRLAKLLGFPVGQGLGFLVRQVDRRAGRRQALQHIGQ